MLMLTELVCQWMNTAAFVVPNAALLARPCEYFSVIIRELLSAHLAKFFILRLVTIVL